MDYAELTVTLLLAAIPAAYKLYRGWRARKRLTDGRCEAITRKGERCRRPTRETRCGQHREMQ